MEQEAREHLIDFCILTNYRYSPNWHHNVIAEKLEEIESGKFSARGKRILMLFLPPRSGKSELATVNFPAWYLGKNPNKEVITVSYSGELAQDFGKKTREIISDIPYKRIFGLSLKEDEKGAAKWKTEKGGSYTSIGVGGALTGRGANILCLDDLIKNREEANSEVYRDKVWSFFLSTAYTRLEPNGVVIVCLTRWHYDDLAGRILNEPEFKDKIEVIEFPAIAEQNEKYRKKGEALWPERYSAEYYESFKRLDLYEFSSLYQQKPLISETQEFKQEYFRYFEENEIVNEKLVINILIDPAISKKDTACDTGIIDVAKIKDKPEWFILDDASEKIDPGKLIETVFKKVENYKKDYDCIVNVWVETVAYQEALSYWFKEKMRDKEVYFTINEIHTKSDKEQRIRGLIPLYKQGIIKHRPAMKGGKLEQQAVYFPFGKLVDSLDALSFNLQATVPTKKKSLGSRSTEETSDNSTGY
jgi:hypothetical protein